MLHNAEPRLVKQPFELGEVTYPPGVVLFASAYLVHHDPAIYPEPYAFRPERFLEQSPGTYTWLPFGGGRRRCLGEVERPSGLLGPPQRGQRRAVQVQQTLGGTPRITVRHRRDQARDDG